MTVVGSDANKVYDDVLYDAVNKQIIDAGQDVYKRQGIKLSTEAVGSFI